VSPKEVFHFGEVRQLALGFHNKGDMPEQNMVARVGLSQGMALQPDSTCIYRGVVGAGAYSAGTSLVESAGLRLGSIAPRANVYVTFKVKLPTLSHETRAAAYGAIDRAEDLPEPNWYGEGNAPDVLLPLSR
jgi:hypothetical protein